LRVGLILGGLVAAVGVGLFGSAYLAVGDQSGSRVANAAKHLVKEVVRPDLIFDGRSRVNILLIGEDVSLDNRRQRIKEPSRSDTNIIISLDRVSKSAHILSLPRDTKVIIPGHDGAHKLNAAHRYGGPYLLMDTIRENFGVTVDHYVKTNFHGFIELVDLVGGIEVDVERSMNYDDSWQDFHVHLEPGLQHLDGESAHGYVRWRKNLPPPRGDGKVDPRGDLGRVERQQKVIKILARKALSPEYLPKLRGMITTAKKYLETTLSDRQLLSLLLFLDSLDPETLDTATMPSEYTGFFVEVDREAAEPLLMRMFGSSFDPYRLRGGSAGGDHGLDLRERLAEPQPSRLRSLDDQPPPLPAVVPEEAAAVADDEPFEPTEPAVVVPAEPAAPTPEPEPAPARQERPIPPDAPGADPAAPPRVTPEPAPPPKPLAVPEPTMAAPPAAGEN